MVRVLVLGLDGIDIGVAPAEQNVIENRFLGAWATHGLVKSKGILFQRPAADGCKALAEPAAVLVGQVLCQVRMEGALVDQLEALDLQWVQICDGGNDRLFIRIQLLEGLVNGIGSGVGIPLYDLGCAVSRRWRRWVRCRGRSAIARCAAAVGSRRGAVLSRRRPRWRLLVVAL